MDTWISQPGYPLLTVSRINDTSVKITQNRFAVNTQTEIEPKKYTIPIRYRTNAMSADESTLIWMTKDQESIEVDLGGVRTWYKFNDNQVGYYRVNYEEPMWDELAKVLNTWTEEGANHFSTINRAHLLNDVFALSDGEYLSYNTTMEMMSYLKNEQALGPWTVAISQIKKMLALMATDPISLELASHFHELSRDAYDYVKFSACSDLTDPEDTTAEPPTAVCSEHDDDQGIQLLREKMVDLLCQLEHQECLDQVKTHFNAYIETNTPISPNVRQSVYYYGLKDFANATVWNTMFDRLVVETDPQEVTKLMYGLTATTEIPLVTTYLERAWNEMKQQDFFTVLTNLSENPVAQSIVWEWVQTNWERLVDRYTINERTLGRVIPNITKRFSTQSRLDQLEAFFVKYPEAGAGAAAREEARETITTNIRWMTVNKPIIQAWLDGPKGK